MAAIETFDNIRHINTGLTKKERRRLRLAENKKPNAGLEIRYINPKTENQCKAFDYYEDGLNLSLLGYPGTGKSFISLYLALAEVEKNDSNSPNSVTIIRSVVPARDIGFLPGNEKEKSKVYEAPYVAICHELYGRGDAYEILKQKGIVKFETTSFLRSVTMDNTIVIVDECQNLNAGELHTVITRIGGCSKIIFCGDFAQNDLIFKRGETSGLGSFQKILDKMKSFARIDFQAEDIVRSGLVKEYILTKAKLETE